MTDVLLKAFQDFMHTLEEGQKLDLESMLDFVLVKARRLTFAEAGTIFICEPMLTGHQNALVCAAIQNDEATIEQRVLTLPIDSFSIAGYTILEKKVLKIDDIPALPVNAPYKFNGAFDRRNNYKTISMLSVPLLTVEGRAIGVMQLVNHLSPAGSEEPYAPFREEDKHMMESLGAMIGMVIERTALVEEVSRLRAAHAPMRVTS